MHSPEALLNAVGIPREVVVDHEVRGLEVETLARRVGRKQDLAVAVFGELLGDLASLRTSHAAMDRTDCARAADQRCDAVGEVIEGVAMLGEDDELAGPPVVVGGERVVLEDLGEFAPLAIGAEIANEPGGSRRSASSMSSASSSATVRAAVAESSNSSSSSSISSALNSSRSRSLRSSGCRSWRPWCL